MKVAISTMLLHRIRALAQADAREICGLLLGQSGRIDAILPAPNVAADPHRHFEIDPAVLIAAHRAARKGGGRIIGHYHSHPSGSPFPSATDAARAAADGAYWMIVASGEVRLWRAGIDGPSGVAFAAMQLVVVDEAGVASPGPAAH